MVHTWWFSLGTWDVLNNTYSNWPLFIYFLLMTYMFISRALWMATKLSAPPPPSQHQWHSVSKQVLNLMKGNSQHLSYMHQTADSICNPFWTVTQKGSFYTVTFSWTSYIRLFRYVKLNLSLYRTFRYTLHRRASCITACEYVNKIQGFSFILWHMKIRPVYNRF